MTHDDSIFKALAFYRYVGADAATLQSDAKYRQRRPCTGKAVQATLRRLESEDRIVQVESKWFLTPQGLKLAKGPAVRPAWLPGDYLILMALFCCRRNEEGVELHDIIAAADYIDHSIPTLEQMHGALNRLESGGLLKKRRGGFAITGKAKDLYAKVEAHSRKAVRSQLQALERILECPCCGIPLKKVRWKIFIDDSTMKDALSHYTRSMQA